MCEKRFGSEEREMHGAYEWAERHDLDDIKCIINIDGAGDTRDLKLMTNTFEGMTGPFERVADRLAVPLRIERIFNTTTDGWPFVERGIPAVTVASDRSQSGRGWGHTHADTLDKLDLRVLRDLAISIAMISLECVSNEYSVDRKESSSILDALLPKTEKRMKRLG